MVFPFIFIAGLGFVSLAWWWRRRRYRHVVIGPAGNIVGSYPDIPYSNSSLYPYGYPYTSYPYGGSYYPYGNTWPYNNFPGHGLPGHPGDNDHDHDHPGGPPGHCVQTQMCMNQMRWDSTQCKCVPSGPPTPAPHPTPGGTGHMPTSDGTTNAMVIYYANGGKWRR